MRPTTATHTPHDPAEEPGTGSPEGATGNGLAVPALTLPELAARLQLPCQTLYDLRSQGRGPRGFRVGRQLRFRAGEIEAWLERLEQEDAQRHPHGGPR